MIKRLGALLHGECLQRQMQAAFVQLIKQLCRLRHIQPRAAQQLDLPEYLLGRPVGQNAAVRHGDHAPGQRSLAHMVRNEHDRNAGLAVEAHHRLEPLPPALTADLDESALRKTIPVGRFGEPEEVADLVAFLVSKQAGYITGEVISINGGIF